MNEEKKSMLEFLKILIRRNQLDENDLTEALKFLGAREYTKEYPSVVPDIEPDGPSKSDKEKTLEFLRALIKSGVIVVDDLIDLLKIIITRREEKYRKEDEPLPVIGDDPEPRPFHM